MKYDLPYPEEPSQREKQSCQEWGLGGGSFSTLMARDQDVSFGTGSPIFHDVQSSTFKCRSSFSSFLAEPSTPIFAPGGFSFHNGDDSNALEFMSPVSSMPSFAFSSAGPVIEVGSSTLELSSNISRIDSVCGGNQLSEISLGKMLLLPEPSLCCGCEAREMENSPVEVKRAGAEIGSRALGIHGKRNRTIGLGECEQLDLMVTESVIRWASCTHLPTAPSLRSSLVC
jgi:calcium-dependent protein kinase